jgi:hypothetical protein
LPSWIRIRNLNADPDPATQINADPSGSGSETLVLVDFKAIYPGVPPGIFASFPGVAHFLSFEQICQYPRVNRKSTVYPGVLYPRGRPRGNPNTLG